MILENLQGNIMIIYHECFEIYKSIMYSLSVLLKYIMRDKNRFRGKFLSDLNIYYFAEEWSIMKNYLKEFIYKNNNLNTSNR